MWMPWAQLGFNSELERRFLNALVQLKEMRMSGTDADPDYFDLAFRRKRSNTFYRQKKGAKFNCLEFLRQA